MNSTSSINYWQFYLTASFLAAAAVVWLSPPAPPVALVFMSLAVFGAGACAAALHAALLAFSRRTPRESEVSANLRAALEREKLLALRAIKDLQFDMAMGKVSAADAAPMEVRLRERATAIMRQLDGRDQLRLRIEREIAARQTPDSRLQVPGQPPGPESGARSLEPGVCIACGTAKDPNAKFCKECGAKL